MDKLRKVRKGIAKILVVLTIMWCIVELNSDIVIAGVDDYIDWHSENYVDLLNSGNEIYQDASN